MDDTLRPPPALIATAAVFVLVVIAVMAIVGMSQAPDYRPLNCAIMLHTDPSDAWTSRLC